MMKTSKKRQGKQRTANGELEAHREREGGREREREETDLAAFENHDPGKQLRTKLVYPPLIHLFIPGHKVY